MGATLFSGIDAPEVSAPAIDWLWRAEIDKFPNAVSKHRRPDTPNLGDVSAPDFVERALQHGRPDIIVFGSPCQSFSVAGKRLGMDDPRGNLALVALEVVRRIRPRWFVFENVPGLFSSDEGRDFHAFLGSVEECGYSGCWRVLDAQYAGVPQRRRRLFFVGYLGNWRPAAAVLFEQSSLQGHPAPRRETWQDVAPTISARTKGGGGLGTDFDLDGGIVGAISAKWAKGTGGPSGDECQNLVAHSLRAEGFDASEDGTGRGTPLVPIVFKENMSMPSWGIDVSETLLSESYHAVAYNMSPGKGELKDDIHITETDVTKTIDTSGADPAMHQGGVAIAFETRFARNGRGAPDTVVPPLKAQSGQTGKGDAAPCVVAPTLRAGGNSTGGDRPYGTDVDTCDSLQPVAMQVRRLTPRECERLQGFPDDYTMTPWRGKAPDQCPDGPRYKALGNSMAVPVIGWILNRVQKVERLT